MCWCLSKRDTKKIIKKRKKEGYLAIPTAYGYMFYNTETRKRKDICVKGI